MQLVDTHAHLEEIEDLEHALTKARASSVIAIIAVGSDHKSNQKVLQLAQVYKGFVYAALGLHPWYIGDAETDRCLDFIEANIDKAVAIGEVGLDYHKRVREQAEKDLQKSVLRKLLKIANDHQKPALIHSRYAWQDALNLVTEAGIEKVVFHWYTGPSHTLLDIISHDYFLSATPAIEYHDEHRRAIKETPPKRLLLETDAPVVYGRGRDFEYQSKPADVLRTIKSLTELTGMSEARLARTTTDNALRLFRL
ncbi:TatD family hydrolase [Chloroflexota bacterium]